MAGDQTFENLTQSKLIQAFSKDDKNVKFQVDVWGGNTSFVVFTGGGARPFKFVTPQQTRYAMATVLTKMRDEPSPQRQAIGIRVFDTDSKKMKDVGVIGFGLDEKLNFVIDIAHNELSGKHQFIIRPNGKFDFLQTNLTERDILKSVLDSFIATITRVADGAERLTSFKQAPGGNRGSGGGGYGGGNNRGGYAANNNQGGGGTFSGGGNNANEDANLYV